jgi:hypothetical protein
VAERELYRGVHQADAGCVGNPHVTSRRAAEQDGTPEQCVAGDAAAKREYEELNAGHAQNERGHHEQPEIWVAYGLARQRINGWRGYRSARHGRTVAEGPAKRHNVQLDAPELTI